MTGGLFDKEHYDLLAQFEKEFKHHRIDREDKSLWAKGYVYQNGLTNDLFLAYRRGYSLGLSVARLAAGDNVTLRRMTTRDD